MKKFLKHLTLLGLALVTVFSLALFAACGDGEDDPNGNGDGTTNYTVTVTCEEAPAILLGLKVQMQKTDGTVVEEKSLSNGTATFTLETGSYRAVLVEAISGVLAGYIYSQPTLTAETPTATINVATPSAEETIVYTVTVLLPDGTPVAGITAQLCGGPEDGDYLCMPSITDADGVATFNLVPGDYEVHIAEIDYPTGYTFDDTKYQIGVEGGSLTVYFDAAA